MTSQCLAGKITSWLQVCEEGGKKIHDEVSLHSCIYKGHYFSVMPYRIYNLAINVPLTCIILHPALTTPHVTMFFYVLYTIVWGGVYPAPPA